MTLLAPTLHKALTAFHTKNEAAKEHGLSFSIRLLSKAVGVPESTLNVYLNRLIEKGYLRKDKKGLTKKGADYIKSL